MAFSVVTNVNIFDDISTTPVQFSNGVTIAHAGVSKPGPLVQLAKRFFVSVFSGDLSSVKPACLPPPQHPIPTQQTVFNFQTILASPRNFSAIIDRNRHVTGWSDRQCF
jgi:hypothetical protein